MNALRITPYEHFLLKSLRLHFCNTESMNTDQDFLSFYESGGESTSDYSIWSALNFNNLDEVFESCSSMAKDFFDLHLKILEK